ncbi:DHA2 family metal-tetracycline-proton antiporter-like MFS transporter [Paenibacillus sp. JGP012]|uniref:MFS transporter n=1 Tax=Paenibacillus sp. JGP012 TaxID=2735914 RepID=UPI00161C9282|nr:MFS transporter [Paenibacillus sp. JGP012]MBB6021320.1 DHA2 family metal-tetracycline-proton antiporter-like MFS transporter [Paenibacillus sp. JGP012]
MVNLQSEEIKKRVIKCMPWILLYEFFQVFNENVFNLITPNLSQEYGVSPSTVSLIVTLGKLFLGIASIVFSALSDIVSTRKLMLFTCFVFPVVTLIGFFSPNSFSLLITARIMFALTIAIPLALQVIIALKYFDKLTAAKYFGYNTAIFQLASAAGHFFGGYITDYFHWNYIFLFPLLTLLGIPTLMKNLPKDASKKGSFDFVGMLLVTIISTLLITFMTFKMQYPLLLISALVCSAIFMIYTRKSKNPFIKPELFKVKGIVWSLIVCGLFYGTQVGFGFIFPFIVHKAYGFPASTIGLFYSLTNIAAFIAGINSGRIISKIGYRNIALLGGLFIFSGLAMVAFLVGFSVVFVFVGMAFFNIGYALFFSGYLSNYTQLLPSHQHGSGVGVERLVLNIGSSLGGALIAMLYGQPYMMNKIVDLSSNPLSAQYSNLALLLMMMIALATFIFTKVFHKNFNRVE